MIFRIATALIVRKSCPAIGQLTEKRRPAPGKRAGLVLSFAGMFEPPRGLAVPVISEAVFASGKSARASAYGGIASIVLIRGEASAEPVTRGTKKQIAAPSCRNLLFSILADICCTISLPRNRRRSHYCRRPPAIVLRRLPFRLLPLRIGPLRSDPAGRFAGRYTYPAKPLAMHC